MKWSSIIKFRYRHQSNGSILKLSTQLWFQIISKVLRHQNREKTEFNTRQFNQSKRDDSRNTAIQHTTQIQLQWIGHFRATKYLCFKTSPSATPVISKRFWFIWKWTFRVNSFSYEWFRTKIYFDRGKKANRKWPILLPSIICAIWTTIYTIYIFQHELFG